jgi:hydroxyethylthiazole kinase
VVAAANLVYTIAAERAAAQGGRPGSFAAAFLDHLDGVDADDLRSAARIGAGAL